MVFCDDNAGIRKLIAAAMRSCAHEVLIGADGAEALELVRRRRPSLVVTDLAMPVMDGLELHDAIRADPALDGIPIAFLTASTQHRMMAQARERQPQALLLKPFSPAQLRHDVDAMLRGDPVGAVTEGTL